MNPEPHPYNNFPPVVVVWRDSAAGSGWTHLSKLDGETCAIVSVGFLINETPHSIEITNGISQWARCNDPLTIPWENVVALENLSLPDLNPSLDWARSHSPR
ncbi:hypothetical protein KKF61_07725 [Patescibacteria group bacterium]|nr:hypothetical protein [Patescibacteria group bacterium]